MAPAATSLHRANRTQLAEQPLAVSAGGFEDGSDSAGVDVGMQLTHDPEKALYDHMPKAGGTFLMHLIRAAVGHRNFDHLGEFAELTQETIDSTFVIGSVRNPCDYYVSLWAYGAERGGAMMSRIPDEAKYVYKTTSPGKDSFEDIRRFRHWVRWINKEGRPGVMSVRFARSYANMDMDIKAQFPPARLDDASLDAVERALSTPDFLQRVDCWVQAEKLDQDTRECLRDWVRKTHVQLDWGAYEDALHHSNQLQSTHSRCNDYFTRELAQEVRALEAPIFNAFGYDSCCA